MDVILIHSPSNFDFRKQLLVTGALTDGINNSVIYEMYPMGFLSMACALQQNGYQVQILNLALKMLKHPNIDVEKYLKSLDAKIFAFDLHWMIHALGALKVSKIVKKLHPNSIILFGGFTSSYFAQELLQKNSHIDMILRGDTVESLLVRIVQNISNPNAWHSIPNLLWRKGDKIFDNGFTFVPSSFNVVNTDFLITLAKMVISSHELDPCSFLPAAPYRIKPTLPILFSKGCTHNCINCGGSQYAMKRVCNRDKIALKPPHILAKEIIDLSNSFNFAIRIIGDFQIAPLSYREKLFRILHRYHPYKIENFTYFEFFTPPPRQYLEQLAGTFSKFSTELSPESGSDVVRKKQGRPYSNDQVLRFHKNVLELNKTPTIYYWFQVGNAFETKETLEETQHLCKTLLKMDPQRTYPFISPLNPYIDPGSIAFEHPDENGYRLLYPTLEMQVGGFQKPIWKYYLNYETRYFSRDELVKISFEQSIRLNELKVRVGALDSDESEFLNRILRVTYRIINILDKNPNFSTSPPPLIRRYFLKEGQVPLKQRQTAIIMKDGNNILDLALNGLTYMRHTLRRFLRI